MTSNNSNEINYLWNCNDEKTWIKALFHYWEKLSFEQLPIESRINNLYYRELELMSVYEFYNFLYNEFFPWKYTAKNRLATTRTALKKYETEKRMCDLEVTKNNIFSPLDKSLEKRIKTVTEIRGLGTSGATALLSVMFPETFGTVDQFVVKALLEVENLSEHNILAQFSPENLRIKDAVIIIKIMRNKADELNIKFNTSFWTPRKIDMILWAAGR